MKHRPAGYSTVEYIVVCAALAFALFVPIADSASGGAPKTTVEVVLDLLQKGYQDFSHAISLPI
ncbi:hypothetical protein [Duganella alba]|jgi:hypothetical protein|nr:hypothetical protein [Duganella alba]